MLPNYRAFITGWVIRIDPAGLEEDCIICTEPFTDPVRIPCSHVYDLHCLAQWLQGSNSCPLCRRELYNNATEQTSGVSQPRLELDGDAQSEALARRLRDEHDEREGDRLFIGHRPHDERVRAPGHSFPTPVYSDAYNDYDRVSQAIRNAIGPGNALPFPAPVASGSSSNRFDGVGNALFPTQGGGPGSTFQDPEHNRVFQNQADTDRNPRGQVNRDLELLGIHPAFVFGREREVLERRSAAREAIRHWLGPGWDHVPIEIARDPFGAEAIDRMAQLERLVWKRYSSADGVDLQTHTQNCLLHMCQLSRLKGLQEIARVHIVGGISQRQLSDHPFRNQTHPFRRNAGAHHDQSSPQLVERREPPGPPVGIYIPGQRVFPSEYFQ